MNYIYDYLGNPIIFWVVWTVFSIIVLFVILGFLRRWTRKKTADDSSYEKVVLRVMVSQDEDEESQRKELKDKIAMMDAVFASLGALKPEEGGSAGFTGRTDHISFEIVADRDGLVTFYIAIPKRFQQYIEQQFQAQFPDSVVEEVRDYNIFQPQGKVIGSDLKLDKSYIFPFNTYDKMTTDPLNGLTNALSKFTQEEGAIVQVIIRPADPEWRKRPVKVASEMQQGKKLKDALAKVDQSGFTKFMKDFWKNVRPSAEKEEGPKDTYRLSPAEEELVKNMEEKASKAGFEVNIRLLVSSDNEEKAKLELTNIMNAFSQFSLFEKGNTFKAHAPTTGEDIINAAVHRRFDEKNSFILNTTELASIWHPPLPSTETPNIRWLMAKKAPPPSNLPKEGLELGIIEYRGKTHPVRFKRDDRMRHLYIIGKTGSGKSSFFRKVIKQDLENGDGVCVMDPHGELAEETLGFVPPERYDDVIYFDPGNIERPMGLNMLEFKTKDEMDFAAGEMISIFYQLFGGDMIGPMFEHYMRNAMLALMEDTEKGATIVEIPRMFTDEKFRKERVEKLENAIVKNFWEAEFEQSQAGQQAADMLTYVISKIGRFLTNELMRNIIGQKESAFSFDDVMNQQKILMVNLSKGRIGEINSNLLGMVIIAKLQMAAMARASMDPKDRKDFFVYLDEFQNFLTPSISSVLSEARKYRFSLNIAHQYIGQLTMQGGDTQIRDAIFGNVGSMMAFRMGAEDAEFMEKEFDPVFDQNDLINCEKYTTNTKLLIDGSASRPFNMAIPFQGKGPDDVRQKLMELSYTKFGRDRQEISDEIRERAAIDTLGLDPGADDLMEGFF